MARSQYSTQKTLVLTPLRVLSLLFFIGISSFSSNLELLSTKGRMWVGDSGSGYIDRRIQRSVLASSLFGNSALFLYPVSNSFWLWSIDDFTGDEMREQDERRCQ